MSDFPSISFVRTLLQLLPELDQLTGTEARLVASAAIVLTALVLAVLIVPFIIGQIRHIVAQRYLGGTFIDITTRINEKFPVTTPAQLLLQTLRATIVVAMVFALLAVWNQMSVLTTIQGYVKVSPALMVRGLVTVGLLVASYVGMGLLDDTMESVSGGTSRMTAHQEQIVTRVIQLSLLIFVGFVILSVWNLNPRGLLVGAGFLGIVVGLAARQTLGSLIAGFVLMFARPFEIGDWVIIGDEGEGVVTDITIVNTRLENFDGEFIVIPNDKVADNAITNRSQKGRLRLRIDIGIDYEADPDHAIEVAQDAIDTVDIVTETPSPQAFPKTFGDSAIVLELRFWIEKPTPPKQWRARGKVVDAVKRAFNREEIKIPYPQRELSGREETGGFQVRDSGDRGRARMTDAVPDGDSTGER